MDELTQFNFDRKRVIKRIKKKFENSLITCKINSTDQKQTVKDNFKQIIKKLNSEFLNDKMFSNKLIYTYLNEIETYFEFLSDYGCVMQSTNSLLIIKDSCTKFLATQEDFMNRLNKEFNVK